MNRTKLSMIGAAVVIGAAIVAITSLTSRRAPLTGDTTTTGTLNPTYSNAEPQNSAEFRRDAEEGRPPRATPEVDPESAPGDDGTYTGNR